MKKILYLSLLYSVVIVTTVTGNVSHLKNPLEVVELIGDKLIRETPFSYRLEIAPNSPEFNKVKFVNFGRAFRSDLSAVAYAYTLLESASEMEFEMELEHNDGCKIWLNDQLIYSKDTIRDVHLVFEERSIEMPYKVKLKLKKGANKFLIKSQTNGNKVWCVYMQPPATKGAVLNKSIRYPFFAPASIPDVDKAIAKLTNWLIVGPFEPGLNQAHEPEKAVAFGFMYPGLKKAPVTWTIPRIEVLGNVIEPKEWGTNYQWNYHNGGVAWAMQQLSEASGNPRYNQWATNFCEYHLKGKPFVEYQVKTLNEFESANHYFIQVPLLDFTLAPALPFIHKLITEKDFPMQNDYREFIDRMMKYARHEQIRYPGTNVYTRTTPRQYTTWVDDMFMGIPFLVQASRYAKTPEEKEFFINDAARMVLGFSQFVWNKDANLYMHANYSDQPDLKLPHWSRANGWGIWATTEVLMQLDKKNKYYKPILEQYRKHVNSLARLQAPSGFWYNVLDRPDSPEEVSGTAIFTLAMARGVTHGWLDARKFEPVVMKAWEALKTQIEPDGKVYKICVGTMCSEDVNYYIQRPFYEDDTHGLFAVLFAGIDVHKMMQRKK
jgi:rhamnogalacturonyl hydrolase YesR